MKFGYRKPSLRKSIAARTSIKRAIRSKYRAPRGWGWVTNPRKATYNRVYNRTTKSCFHTVLFILGICGSLIFALRHL